uniref:Fibronectin type-II domain-containing protein n=1 Tax=Scylla olivacea TaxID=85551 RepID=A0A0P4WA71_SCYOL
MAIGGRLSDVNVLCLIVVFALHAWSVLEGHVLVSRAGQLYQKPVSVPEVVDERDCVFPFWWRSKLHNNCTRLDRPDHWCATQINDAGAPVTSGYCKKFLVGPLPAQPTPTMDDDPDLHEDCEVPFYYNKKTFTNCTMEDSKRPWCAVEVDQLRKPIRIKFCRGKEGIVYHGKHVEAPRKSRGPESNGPITTKNGEACVVPYKFKGKVHMGCYCDGISPCWCPLRISSDYYPLDSDYCADNDTVVPIEHLQVNMSDVPMTVRNGPCTFPFVYNGLAYTKCACVDAPECWCAVSLTQTNEPAVSDYCKDFLIGEIPTVPPPAYGPCINITKDGWACHLPFTYNGRNYTQCTTEGRGRLWCATLLDEQGDIVQWGYCADDDLWDDAVGERRQ